MTISDDFELIRITDTDLVNYTREQNSELWQGQLSRNDYVIRETVLGKSQMIDHHSHDNELHVFMLRNKESKEPVSSIELVVREAIRVDYDGEKAVSKIVPSGTIGGVFTIKEHRSKGYAKLMLQKCVEVAKEEFIGTHGFTFLYSEVGEYYSQFGFKSFPVDLISIPVEEVNIKDGPEPQLLPYHEFDRVFKEYEKQTAREVADLVEKDHKTRIYLRPTSQLVDWFHLRAKYISYKLLHEDSESVDFVNLDYSEIASVFKKTKPNTFGMTFEENGQKVATLVFTIDWKSKTQYYATVLKIIVADGVDREKYTADLVKALLRFLNKNPELPGQKCTQVVIWESELSTQSKEHFIKTFKLEHGIDNLSRSAMLLNNDTDQKALLNGDIEWINNDKLSWF